MDKKLLNILLFLFFLGVGLTVVWCDEAKPDEETIDETFKPLKETDPETLAKEEEAIKIDELNVAQIKEMRDKAEKFEFQAEVDRMMKLIINSLYRNKEIFLRELISNASDALDKIRFLSLTDPSVLKATEEMAIRIKSNKKERTLHIIDTGIGMTKEELAKNLGTIAKSGTSEFMSRLSESKSQMETSDLIGQFGVGFYSSFLVADRVTVISKSNSDEQYIWESDSNSFTIIKDPRGDTLKRGTEIILQLKEDTVDYLEQETLKQLVTKYSQFINFPIHLLTTVKEMVQEETSTPSTEDEKSQDDDAVVEEEAEKKMVEKEVEKWELMNGNKPIWTRKTSEVTDEEYNNFYKAFTKESDEPLAKIHFVAEGEVTFKSILYVPKHAPSDMFRSEGSRDNVKLYVRRVFITDSLEEMMPTYLNFIKGVVDSDDLPLNVSRETLQQSKLLKVMKKKLIKKVIEMIRKIKDADYDNFWREYSTKIKLGVVDDNSNRTRLTKLLRFWSSYSDEKMVSLSDYVSRMKEKQSGILFIAGESREILKKSPFVERALKKGYEVLFMVDPIDEYAINNIPDYEGKKFQNLSKEGVQLDDADSTKVKERKEAIVREFTPLIDWLRDTALTDWVDKVSISDRLDESPCTLVAAEWGNSPNMERLMRAQTYKKAEDQNQRIPRRIMEINPRHPLVKELKSRILDERKDDDTTKKMAVVLYETAVLRSGYYLQDQSGFATRVEHMMRLGLGIPLDETVEEEYDETQLKEDVVTSEETAQQPPEKSDDANDEENKDEL
jgi:heat shock protein 90kDa beta